MTPPRRARALCLALAALVSSALPVAATVGSPPAHAAPALELVMTVGESDGVYGQIPCSGSAAMQVLGPIEVEFCYEMRNTGSETLRLNDVDNDAFGVVLNDIPTQIDPGEFVVVYDLQTVSGTVTSTGTWTALGVGNGFLGYATDTVSVTLTDPELGVATESAALDVAMTVMVDDGTDTCGTDTAAVVDKGVPLRFCYTMTNVGDEALDLHDVRDSHIGQVAGPGHDHLVQPGDGVVLTATVESHKSALHDVWWEATGVESDSVVYDWDYVYVTVLGPEITLDMTVMVDDGHATCGTESEIVVPVGTQVRYCYTMTDSGDEDVNYHDLDDDQLGLLIDHLDREIAPGETLVHTEVAVITEAVTSTATWYALSQGTGTDVGAEDTVTVEIGEEPGATTTTTTTTTAPCVTVTTAPPTVPEPTTTVPDAATTTTDPPATTTTPTTTTTTTVPVTTTTLGLVLPTTTTIVIVGVTFTTTTVPIEPAGFARTARTATPSCPDPPPGGPGTLPPTA